MKEIYKEVIRDFEKSKLASEKAFEKKQMELYMRIPRIAEIDKEMADLGLKLAQMILNHDAAEGNTQAIKEEQQALTREKDTLLYENGYDEGFFDEAFSCQKCQDKGKLDNKYCSCFKQAVISKYFEMSNLGKSLENENFDAFNINYYSDIVDPSCGMSPKDNMARIWTISLNFVESFGAQFENLLLHGDTGLGKTFLSNCIAKELLSRGHTVLYTGAGQLFRKVEDARFNKNEDHLAQHFVSMAYDVDLLIIDDLGTEFATTVTKAEMFNFVNKRLLDKKPTIISTNLSPSDFEDFYTDRITSRFFGEYTFLHFFGDDIRIAKKHGML